MSTPDPVHGYGWNTAERWGGWSWSEPGRGEHFRRCSFCGSIHPEDLAAESSWRAGWADRKYGFPHKFYADIPNRTPEQLHIISAVTKPEMADGYGMQWVPVTEIPEGTVTDGWRDLEGTYSHVGLDTRPSHHAKFYTVHLADPAVSAEARDLIEHRSRLRFRFEDGRVTWEPYAPPNLPDCACHWSKVGGVWSHGVVVPGCRWHQPHEATAR